MVIISSYFNAIVSRVIQLHSSNQRPLSLAEQKTMTINQFNWLSIVIALLFFLLA